MPKNQIIVVIVVAVIILGGIVGWGLIQKGKIPGGEEVAEETEEIFSMTAVVSSVDSENNTLMVKPTYQEEEVKVAISETTKLIKIEFPFDPQNPPEEATFTPEQTEIEISDFEEGDNVFIKTTEDITGKTEINNVDFIHILP